MKLINVLIIFSLIFNVSANSYIPIMIIEKNKPTSYTYCNENEPCKIINN